MSISPIFGLLVPPSDQMPKWKRGSAKIGRGSKQSWTGPIGAEGQEGSRARRDGSRSGLEGRKGQRAKMGRGKRGGASIGVESQKEKKGQRWRDKRDRETKGREGRRVKRGGGKK